MYLLYDTYSAQSQHRIQRNLQGPQPLVVVTIVNRLVGVVLFGESFYYVRLVLIEDVDVDRREGFQSVGE